jgi:serine/threonine protein kinase
MPSVVIGQEIIGPNSELYTIIDFLGRGAFGEVYRASGKTSGNVIAVKLLSLSAFPDDSDRRALLNEMRAGQLIVHPNVVRLLHVEEGENSSVGPYACMEYISGGTLAAFLRAKANTTSTIPVERCLEMMIDIAQGMKAINQKLIHRDIKPDNVLMEGKTLKVADFGISKFIDESTRLHTFKGGQHVAYMAPEGWAGDKNTYKLDVYAVGLVFFEILLGKHPLLGGVKDQHNTLDWQKAHMFHSALDITRERPETPLHLNQLIARMVAKRPNQRPDWDEILKVLSDPAMEATKVDRPMISTAVGSAVTAAVRRHQESEKAALAANRERAEAQQRLELYTHSCRELLQNLRPSIDQFNAEFQSGTVAIGGSLSSRFGGAQSIPDATYQLPGGKVVSVRFFGPRDTGWKLRGGIIIGGGWIGLTDSISANLVLLKEGEDDLYGRWIVCEVKIMALADPRKLIGQFGLTQRTVEPFGFRQEDDYYGQIYYATSGAMHAFTYQLRDDVEEYFASLLVEGCK